MLFCWPPQSSTPLSLAHISLSNEIMEHYEKYWQQLSNRKNDRYRGSPGFDKYPHGFPDKCLVSSICFKFPIDIFDKTQGILAQRERGYECIKHYETSEKSSKQTVAQITSNLFIDPDMQATHCDGNMPVNYQFIYSWCIFAGDSSGCCLVDT